MILKRVLAGLAISLCHCKAGLAISLRHCKAGLAISLRHCKAGLAISLRHCKAGLAILKWYTRGTKIFRAGLSVAIAGGLKCGFPGPTGGQGALRWALFPECIPGEVSPFLWADGWLPLGGPCKVGFAMPPIQAGIVRPALQITTVGFRHHCARMVKFR